MSAAGGGGKASAPEERTGFECAEQVAALLNCVADKSYNEMKCLPLLRKLRTCVEKKVCQRLLDLLLAVLWLLR